MGAGARLAWCDGDLVEEEFNEDEYDDQPEDEAEENHGDEPEDEADEGFDEEDYGDELEGESDEDFEDEGYEEDGPRSRRDQDQERAAAPGAGTA